MQSVTRVVVVLAVVLAVVVAPAAAVPNPLPSNVKTSYKGDITVIAFGGPQTLSDSTMALDQLSSRVTLSTSFGNLAGVYSFDESAGTVDIEWDAGQSLASGTGLGIYEVDASSNIKVAVSTSDGAARPTVYQAADGVALVAMAPVAETPCSVFDYATGQWSDIAESEWRVIKPGGDTICGHGDEFAFAIRRGEAGLDQNVIVEFQGGGACWSAGTCAVDSNFKIDPVWVSALDCATSDISANGFAGSSVAGNPVKGWTHIFVPYCTRDIHWGSETHEYDNGDGTTNKVYHQGFANVQSVLKFMYRLLPNPNSVLVTGCSAGGYGAMMYAPYIMAKYPDTEVSLIADSSFGVIGTQWARDGFRNWNAECAFPTILAPEIRPRPEDYTWDFVATLMGGLADAIPRNHFGMYSTLHDSVQAYFVSLMGIGPKSTEEFAERMMKLGTRVQNENHNFRLFIDAGTEHCSFAGSEAFGRTVDGVSFADWAASVIDGDKTVQQSVMCPTCKVGLNGCDDQGGLYDACGTCGGTCEIAAVSVDDTCSTSAADVIEIEGTCSDSIPQAVWLNDHVYDSFCSNDLHVCCGPSCAAASYFETSSGKRFFRRTDAAMQGMEQGSDDCASYWES